VRQAVCLPHTDATGVYKIMDIVCSGSSKKIAGDTRNNWVTMMFTTKNRYMCFRKQSHINTCVEGFYELECFGFEFKDFGFAGNHVHFQVNIPKKYSVEDAEIMLKSWSAKRMFEIHPGFRKRYSRGSFWSGYEHHESTGRKNLDESSIYIRDQQHHHGVVVVDDAQQKLDLFFPPSGDAA
jgi:REP element-mobilizing transposase RayT